MCFLWSILTHIDVLYHIIVLYLPLFSMKFEMIPFLPSSTHLVAYLLKILNMSKVVITVIKFDKGRQHGPKHKNAHDGPCLSFFWLKIIII